MFCLADKNSVKVPCAPCSRQALVAANLGSKDVVICQSASREEFKAIIFDKYPKLKDCGGFELLRCIPNSKDLDHSLSLSVLNC